MPAYAGCVPSGQAVAGTAVRHENHARNPRFGPASLSPAPPSGAAHHRAESRAKAPPGIRKGIARTCPAEAVPEPLVTFTLQEPKSMKVDQGML